MQKNILCCTFITKSTTLMSNFEMRRLMGDSGPGDPDGWCWCCRCVDCRWVRRGHGADTTQSTLCKSLPEHVVGSQTPQIQTMATSRPVTRLNRSRGLPPSLKTWVPSWGPTWKERIDSQGCPLTTMCGTCAYTNTHTHTDTYTHSHKSNFLKSNLSLLINDFLLNLR